MRSATQGGARRLHLVEAQHLLALGSERELRTQPRQPAQEPSKQWNPAVRLEIGDQQRNHYGRNDNAKEKQQVFLNIALA